MIESSPAHWYQEANTLFTAIIAMATVLYTVVSAFLLWNNRKSIQLTRELFQAANRPVVGTQSVKTRQQDDFPVWTSQSLLPTLEMRQQTT